jgi:hypothetical protein
MLILLLLLALPLVALLLVLLLALLPLSLWQRYRVGSSRRRAWSWVLALGWWASLVSSALFAVSAAAAGLFWPNAWLYSAIAWPAGLLLGALGHVLTRFEATPQGLYYQSNRWLVLGLTALVAVRVGAGVVQAFRILAARHALAGDRLAQPRRPARHRRAAAGLCHRAGVRPAPARAPLRAPPGLRPVAAVARQRASPALQDRRRAGLAPLPTPVAALPTVMRRNNERAAKGPSAFAPSWTLDQNRAPMLTPAVHGSSFSSSPVPSPATRTSGRDCM